MKQARLSSHFQASKRKTRSPFNSSQKEIEARKSKVQPVNYNLIVQKSKLDSDAHHSQERDIEKDDAHTKPSVTISKYSPWY